MIKDLLLLLLLLPINLIGGHVIGGEMAYEFLSESSNGNSNIYKIYLKIYDECTIVFSEYKVFAYRNGDIYNDTSSNDLGAYSLELDSSRIINNLNYNCYLLPSNVCTQESFYSQEIELPIDQSSYILVFQNCCRSVGISNIFDSQNTGFTYQIEITPTAQQLQNSSPTILEIPPSALCFNQDITVSIDAYDIDGDQLVYSLCSPLTYLGNPNPILPLPPPYQSVNFIPPEYSPSQPLGLSSNLMLDANSGLLSVTPQMQGKYVVGICIEEYRNGQLLSTVLKDFQFNVTTCIPLLNIELDSSNILNENDLFVFDVCKSEEINIENQSTNINYINQFYWTFDFIDYVDTIYDWHPTLHFNEGGTYYGKLFLNPEGQCSDTANLIINVNTNLIVDFEVNYDTCVGGEVKFSNTSLSDGGEIIDWNWNFGDNNLSNEENPYHLYQTPGEQEPSLSIINEFGCKDSVTKKFNWLPAPPIIVVAPNTFAGCSPLSVFFENFSSPVDSNYNIFWDFGNGDFSTVINPSYLYENDGVYDIKVSITSPIGCSIDTSFTQWIQVESPPIAAFEWQPQLVSNFSSEVNFIDFSIFAETWEWDFNQLTISFEQNPSYVFPDTGLQEITLKVTDQYGCKDSLTQYLDVVPQTTYFLPNAFTPNQDAKNEIYIGKGVLERVVDFQMNIWNRWGELVFVSKSPEIGWDGSHFKSNKLVQSGVYICHVKFKTNRGVEKEFKKQLVLIK